MLSNYELDYMRLIRKVLDGDSRETRSGPTSSIFGSTLYITDLRDSRFPVLNGRRIFYKGVLAELAAFLKGPQHLDDFHKEGCPFWDEWADNEGNLVLDYGNLWHNFEGVNQLDRLITGIEKDPYGRRHIISNWHPGHVDDLSLPCCHVMYQFYVDNGGHLSIQWYQRSADLMIGVPSNVVSASALLVLVSHITGYLPGDVRMVFGDCHIYDQHRVGMAQYIDQLSDHEVFRYKCKGSPFYKIDSDSLTVGGFNKGSIELIDYDPAPVIKFPINV